MGTFEEKMATIGKKSKEHTTQNEDNKAIEKKSKKRSTTKKVKWLQMENVKRSNDMLRMSKNRRGKIYGSNYVFLKRRFHCVRAHRIGKPMRRVTNAMDDNPLSQLHYEMRLQNKVTGIKKKCYRFRKRPWFGPRFKVQSRIGVVHHRNVDDEIFKPLQQEMEE